MRRSGTVLLVATMLTAADAFAAEGEGQGEDVDTLVKHLGEEHAALSTQDCITACKALGSIRRAADRICALEPGPRCTDARAKADDAQRRVQAACPDCQIAAAPPKDEERRATTRPAPEPPPPTVSAKSAPPERSKGGCASCSTPGEAPTGDFAVMMLAALAVARSLRARSRARTGSLS
jgi:MYXO-CTERM domain-containing protein